MCISQVGVIACALNLIGWFCLIRHQTQETTGREHRIIITWEVNIYHKMMNLACHNWSYLTWKGILHYLLTILWTSVFPSGFACSVLGGGEQLNQSGLESLLSGERSENSGSSSRSLGKQYKSMKLDYYMHTTSHRNICFDLQRFTRNDPRTKTTVV